VVHGDARRRDLHEQLGQRLERHDVVQHAQDDDHHGAEQNALHRAVDLGEDQHGEQKREKMASPPRRGIGTLCIRRLSLGTSMAPTL
jgi:hypothetical protein